MEKSRFSQYIHKINSFLMRPVDASTLGVFRIVFGLLMTWSTIKYFYMGWIKTELIDPKIFFTYELFPWVTPWPGDGMYYQFAIMGISAFFLAIGLFYRVSAVVFFLTYTHYFLIDQTYFNNHFYFICLLGFLFCFINANSWMSIDNLLKKGRNHNSNMGMVPYWNVFLIKSQVFIVYFYGGIAKFNLDWLNGEPLRHWLRKSALNEGIPQIIAKFLNSEFAAYFFSYGGLIFDLLIGFLLLYKNTRLMGFIFLLIFNVTNHFLFTIGVFPFLMIGATIMFLEPDTPRKLIGKFIPAFKNFSAHENKAPRFSKSVITFVSIYLLIQVLVPFRHFLYEGNAGWTEEGRLFAWRMKLSSKTKCRFKINVTRPDAGETWPIVMKEQLTFRQYTRVCRSPQMAFQFAKKLGEKLIEEGIKNPIIKAKTSISFNYRPPQPIIDSEINLFKVKYSLFKHSDWIIPLKR